MLEHVKDLNKGGQKGLKKGMKIHVEKYEFPIQIFPLKIQNLIKNAEDTIGFNSEYLSAGLLSVFAESIGTSASLNNGSYDNFPILWLAVVGSSGSGKTHPLNFAKLPISKKDSQSYNKYFSDLQKFHSDTTGKVKKPKYYSNILGDFTVEKLAENLAQNEKGVLLFQDELIGWIRSFDKYRKGSDQQTYLELFNGDTLTVDRVSKAPIRVNQPIVNILGGLQPSVLKEMAAKNRDTDGFLARFLFVYPDSVEPKLFKGKKIDKSLQDNYNQLIDFLYDMPKTTLNAQQSQINIYKDWQHKNVVEHNGDDLEVLIQSKLETYVWRFALIIELIHKADKGSFNSSLSDKSIDLAIELAEYFRENAYRVYNKITNTFPLDNYTDNKKELFKALPEKFKIGDVKSTFEQYKVKGGSISRFLNKKELFIRLDSQGNYQKRFA